MKVESMLESTMSEIQRSSVTSVVTHVADTPGSIAFLAARSHLIGLTINA